MSKQVKFGPNYARKGLGVSAKDCLPSKLYVDSSKHFNQLFNYFISN